MGRFIHFKDQIWDVDTGNAYMYNPVCVRKTAQ